MDTAALGDHQFKQLTVRACFTILSYHYTNLNETSVQALLQNSPPVLRNLSIETIRTELDNVERFTAIPVPYLQVIFEMRQAGVAVISNYILDYVARAGKSVSPGTITKVVQLWLDLCVTEIIAIPNNNRERPCYLDSKDGKWKMIGTAKTAMLRHFALRDILR